MDNAACPCEKLDSGDIEDKFSSTNKSPNSMEGLNGGKHIDCYEDEGWEKLEAIDSLSADYVFYQDHRLEPVQHQQLDLDYGLFGDPRSGILSPTLQAGLQDIAKLDETLNGIQEVIAEQKNKKHEPVHLASLELLRSYGNGVKRLNSERIIEPTKNRRCTKVESQELSTEEIMRIAGARFIESSTQMVDVASMLNNPFQCSFSGLSDEDAKKVELAELLLASAEKVGNQQFDLANRLLNQCDYLSSDTGNPVQRIAYYFSEVLRERINRETGRMTSQNLEKGSSFNIDEVFMAPTSSVLAVHQEVPFAQVVQLAGVQAIVEHVSGAKKIHVIDLAIRNGVQWTVLMQALVSQSEYPIEHLKITAIGTTLKKLIEDTGKRLICFAETINLPFSFKIVMVSDILDLKEDLFDLEADETVAVYCECYLRSLIALPDRLDSLMKVIRKLNPCVMVVGEVELNTSSPAFVNRFIETLFFFCAYFDCLDDCMRGDDENRMIIEAVHFGETTKNVLATDGEERRIRNVKLDVWRAFFVRFGMEETELSTSSLYQANLVVENFICGRHCTLEMDGKSLFIGWKGTPIHTLSVWKFVGQ